MRHAGVAARVRNKTCYPPGNGLRWTDPEVIALSFIFARVENTSFYETRYGQNIFKGVLYMKKKMKTFVENHKTEIIGEVAKIGYLTLGCVVGYAIGCKAASFKMQMGLEMAYKQEPALESLLLSAVEKAKESLKV